MILYAEFRIDRTRFPVNLSFSQQNVKCKDGTTGSIDLNVSGGTLPYSYTWSNGAVTQDISNLKTGIYRVKVSDANHCTDSLQIVINEPQVLQISQTSTDVTCKGSNSGAIDITSSGGTLPYTFAWSNGAITEDISNLTGGVYELTLTDKEGCTAEIRVVIGEPDSLKLSLTPDDVDCNGLSSGTILSTVSGGSKPYRYSWSNGSILPNVFGLPAGTYTLTVMDSNHCGSLSPCTDSGEPPNWLNADWLGYLPLAVTMRIDFNILRLGTGTQVEGQN